METITNRFPETENFIKADQEKTAQAASASHSSSLFFVEKIVDTYLDQNGQLFYLVKWKNTWEPTENLVHCEALIKDILQHKDETCENEKHEKQEILDDTEKIQEKEKKTNPDVDHIPTVADTNQYVASIVDADVRETSSGNILWVKPSLVLKQKKDIKDRMKKKKPNKSVVSKNLKKKKSHVTFSTQLKGNVPRFDVGKASFENSVNQLTVNVDDEDDGLVIHRALNVPQPKIVVLGAKKNPIAEKYSNLFGKGVKIESVSESRKQLKTPTEMAADVILKRYRSINPKPVGYNSLNGTKKAKAKAHSKREKPVFQSQNYTIVTPKTTPELSKNVSSMLVPINGIMYNSAIVHHQDIQKVSLQNQKPTIVPCAMDANQETPNIPEITIEKMKPLVQTVKENQVLKISNNTPSVMLSEMELHQQILNVIPDHNNSSLVKTVSSSGITISNVRSLTKSPSEVLCRLCDTSSEISATSISTPKTSHTVPTLNFRAPLFEASAVIPGIAASASVRGILPPVRMPVPQHSLIRGPTITSPKISSSLHGMAQVIQTVTSEHNKACHPIDGMVPPTNLTVPTVMQNTQTHVMVNQLAGQNVLTPVPISQLLRLPPTSSNTVFISPVNTGMILPRYQNPHERPVFIHSVIPPNYLTNLSAKQTTDSYSSTTTTPVSHSSLQPQKASNGVVQTLKPTVVQGINRKCNVVTPAIVNRDSTKYLVTKTFVNKNASKPLVTQTNKSKSASDPIVLKLDPSKSVSTNAFSGSGLNISNIVGTEHNETTAITANKKYTEIIKKLKKVEEIPIVLEIPVKRKELVENEVMKLMCDLIDAACTGKNFLPTESAINKDTTSKDVDVDFQVKYSNPASKLKIEIGTKSTAITFPPVIKTETDSNSLIPNAETNETQVSVLMTDADIINPEKVMPMNAYHKRIDGNDNKNGKNISFAKEGKKLTELPVPRIKARRDDDETVVLKDIPDVVEFEYFAWSVPADKDETLKCFTKVTMDKHGRTYQCGKCHKKFSREKGVIFHVRSVHYGWYPYICPLCKKGYANRADVYKHMNTHIGVQTYSCKICLKDLPNEMERKQHYKMHYFERRFQCDICGMRYGRKSALIKHQQTHNIKKQFCCQYCTRAFTFVYDMIAHERIHTGERPYKCRFCPKAFRRCGYLNHHEFTHTGKSIYQCKICDEYFQTRNYMNTHIAKKHPDREIIKEKYDHWCPVCFSVFENGQYLETHQHNKHASALTKHVFCRICKLPCDTWADKRRHEFKYHGNELENKNLPKSVDELPVYSKNKDSIVPFATNSEVTNSGVTNGEVTNSGATDGEITISGATDGEVTLNPNSELLSKNTIKSIKHRCVFCDRAFTGATLLVKHYESHSMFSNSEASNSENIEIVENASDLKYKCSYCNLAYRESSELFLHESKHDCYPQGSNDCYDCNLTFAFPHQVVGHLKSGHEVVKGALNKGSKAVKDISKKKDYDYSCCCEVCGKLCNCAAALNWHMAFKHNVPEDQFFRCDKCDKLFRTARDIEKHMLRNHSNFNCLFCPMKFEVHSKMVKHVHDFHNCKHCVATFHATEDLKLHMHIKHFGSRLDMLYKCALCVEDCVFMEKGELQAHLVVKHKPSEAEKHETSYTCLHEKEKIDLIILAISQKQFIMDEQLLKIPELPPAPPKIRKVPKKYVKEIKLPKILKEPKKPIKNKNLKQPKEAKQLNVPKTKKQKRPKVMKLHKKNKVDEACSCPKCEEHFDTHSEMHVHQRVEHHSCHICGMFNSNPSELETHVTEHKQNEVVTLEKQTFKKPNKKRKTNIEEHGVSLQKKKKNEELIDSSKYRCKICERCFPTIGHVRRHIPTHLKNMNNSDLEMVNSHL